MPWQLNTLGSGVRSHQRPHVAAWNIVKEEEEDDSDSLQLASAEQAQDTLSHSTPSPGCCCTLLGGHDQACWMLPYNRVRHARYLPASFGPQSSPNQSPSAVDQTPVRFQSTAIHHLAVAQTPVMLQSIFINRFAVAQTPVMLQSIFINRFAVA